MSDNLDKFLAFGSSFDFVTPICDLVRDLSSQSHNDLYIARHAGYSAGAIKRALKRSRVSPWGLDYTDDLIIFRVKSSDVAKAEDTLSALNIRFTVY